MKNLSLFILVLITSVSSYGLQGSLNRTKVLLALLSDESQVGFFAVRDD